MYIFTLKKIELFVIISNNLLESEKEILKKTTEETSNQKKHRFSNFSYLLCEVNLLNLKRVKSMA